MPTQNHSAFLETTLPTLLSYDSTIYNVDTSNGIVLYGYGELGKLADIAIRQT